MERLVVQTPDRIHYEYSMKEFKELLGITDENDVLTVNISMSSKKVTLLMSWQ